MPLSNERAEGYENRIAEALARDLGRRVEYTYFPQRMGFVRNTLRNKDERTQQFKCDVIIGVPKGYELTATTRPYMRSTYALVFPWRKDLDDVRTADDLTKLPPETRRSLRIGVFGRSPGADWLLRNEMIDRAVVYAPQSGDPAESPAHMVEQDLLSGKTDLAIVWGPIAGFLVGRHAEDPCLACRTVHAGRCHQVRLRDIDGRALRREGMEGDARSVDRRRIRPRSWRSSPATAYRCSTQAAS